MTKLEYAKCEKLLNDAFRLVQQSEIEYKQYNLYIKQEVEVKAETEQRKADQHYGEALGIKQVLATIGFKHERMITLGILL